MTKKTRSGLIESTSSGIEGEIPVEVVTNKNKRKVGPRSNGVDEIEEIQMRGNLGNTITKKGKTLEGEEDGYDTDENVEDERVVVPNAELGGPSRKGRQAPINWKRDGKMVVSTDGNLFKYSKKVVDAYGSPGGLFKLVKKMTEEQKRSVEEIGFGGLLEIRASGMYHVMIDWLMKCYDPDSRMFTITEGRYFVLTTDDVYDLFMLPCNNGKEVLRTSSKKKDNPDLELMETWRERLGITAGQEISSDKLVDDMLEMPHGGHDFKQFFVLYVMGTFLAPTCHNHVDLRLIKAVENVEDIINQDWCLYVLEKLDEAVEKWRGKKTKNVGGCMMLLQILYFHRLIWRGNVAKSTLPLVKHWTYEEIKGRVEEERAGALKNNNEYGKGGWEKKTYPVSRYLPKAIYRLPCVDNDPKPIDINRRTITFDLPSDLLSNEEIQEKYKDPRVVNWMMTKRDLEIVSRLHESRTKEVEKQPVDDNPIVVEEGLEEIEGEFTQALKNPEFLAQYLAMGRRIDEIAAMKLIEPPSFDLGIDFSGVNDSVGNNGTKIAEPSEGKSVHWPKPPRVMNKSVYVRRCTRLATKKAVGGGC